MQMKKAVSLLLTLVLLLGVFAGITPSASAAAADATLSVDLDPERNTGEIIHGAAGFLYGISSEDVPTTNTIVPLKSKILCTKGAVGTEHPYGDALDVAKTFLESGGQQVMMYNSNYYGVFGVTATIDQYCNDLKYYICPAVVAWKNAWKQEHGTPENPKDNFGKIDIDQAIVYIPINEGTPAGGNFYEAWEQYYKAIKEVDSHATLAGPNSCAYGAQFSDGQSMAGYIQYCADNNCMPDVITWHELDTGCLSPNGLAAHMRDFKNIWEKTNWTKYNAANNATDTPEIPQICINEYAEMAYCGVPGRLVNWISRLEDEKITGCLPFWHQANNLNDLAAGANEGNGAWWLYQWYGNMSGTTQPVSSTTSYDKLYGVSTMDDAKRISTTLLGGYTGSIDVKLNNVTKTQTFKNAEYVNVTAQETAFSGFHGAANDTPVILKGVYPVAKDGSVTVTIENTLFENAYNVTLTQASETDAQMAGLILKGSSGDVYEAENAALSGSAAATAASSNPSYYMSGSGNRAVSMPTGAELAYTINVPVDGKYKLEFVYGNGQGTVRNDMNQHDPVNAEQSFSLDGGEAESITMESTLFQTMTGIKTKYYDLTAGAHTITVKTLSAVGNDMLFHDFVRVSYAGVYGQELPLLNKVYEAELADFNKLLGNADSTVRTETSIDGYSGGGYVTGLNSRSVTAGGGIRFTVVVENSGLYNLSLRYQSASAGLANIYVGNSAVILDRVNATVALSAANGWTTTTASVYLQKGINVVDIDTSVDAAIDYLRVRETGDSANSKTIEAESAIPESMKDRIQTAQSSGASGSKYVVGMPGAYTEAERQYLKFTYNAPADGSYQMQVFHSNEDLAGSHSYNIKATDKYAVFEVNDQSDSPKFEPAKAAAKTIYFVDCGDHDPSTVSSGDTLGTHNSVTDKIYSKDSTGYHWGIIMETADEENLGWSGGSLHQYESDRAVYTTYQRALSNDPSDFTDGKSKTETFRYAHGQDSAGINPRYVSYQFELEPKAYDVTVCMGNTWNNAGSPKVTLTADGVDSVEQSYQIGHNTHATKTMRIDLTNATLNENGKVDLKVKATSNDDTLQMNYILISAATDSQPVTLPGAYLADAEKFPGSVYLGKLTADVPWMIDYRNLKTSTDRYFFMNTFSDDTFREKTINLKLRAGENTIRVYNDNSWNVTYGGTQWLPATTWVRNETPNFDKFVITPMTLAQPIQQEKQYNVSVATSQGGKAVSDKNVVEENGSYKVTIYPDAGLTDIRVLVNGVPHTPTAQDGHYVVQVSDVTSDQTVGVYFSISDENLSELLNRFKALNASDYTTNSWSAAAAAAECAKALINAENPAANEITDAYQRLSTALDELVEKSKNVVYFVDCGDHDPSTVSGKADDFGRFNSVTDQIYGADSKTDYSWGVVLETAGEENLGWRGGSWHQYESDKAVYTTYQRALSNDSSDFADGKEKTETFRYAHGQDSTGINPRYVSYQFELEPKEYDVTVCMGNSWGNAANPTVTLSTDNGTLGSHPYTITQGSNVSETLHIDLTNATANGNGKIDLKVRATSSDPTIQMNYIVIAETAAAHQHTLKHVNRTEPTTEAEGNIEYWECTSCGKKFADADGTDEIANVTLPKLDKPSRPSNPIIPILPILSGNTEEKFPFKDVSKADWYYDSVRSAWKNNLIDGVTATEFRPDSTLTVAQAIKLAAALHQLDRTGEVSLKNGGVNWYDSYVNYAVTNGIIEKDYANYTKAQMNAPVTRGEFVHIFHGAESAYAAINTVADNSIPDVKMTDKFAAEIYEFYRAGVLTGSDAKGTFHSASSIKRSEVSAILVRMFDTASRQNITLK